VRAVVDTNVLLSGLLWDGPAHALLEHARHGDLILVMSPGLIAELAGVLTRAKFRTILVRSNSDPGPTPAERHRLAETVDPPLLPAPRSRDPDDDAVLARRRPVAGSRCVFHPTSVRNCGLRMPLVFIIY
jgi:putative PIN family toxin of toxin-antitoxin system